jgi:hypothetical protein
MIIRKIKISSKKTYFINKIWNLSDQNKSQYWSNKNRYFMRLKKYNKTHKICANNKKIGSYVDHPKYNSSNFIYFYYDRIFYYANNKVIREIYFRTNLTTETNHLVLNGRNHNENGPAIIHGIGVKEWWINGKVHRMNGPAIEYPDGRTEYWINNIHIEALDNKYIYDKEKIFRYLMLV